jgi:hypothetical protein
MCTALMVRRSEKCHEHRGFVQTPSPREQPEPSANDSPTKISYHHKEL